MILSEGPRNVKEIKADKRNREVKPVAGGVTRRQFLTYLGAGSTALAAASAGVAPKSAEAQEFVGGASTPYKNYGAGSFQPAFGPIAPTDADELILPAGFAYDIVRRWGEPVTSDGGEFGFNCDYVAYFPIDALQGGRNSYDGLLFVSHEYVDPKWVSGYGDEDVETEKTVEQINTEKAAVGGSVFRVICNAHGNWEFVADEDFNRRIDATTPMDVTGPAAGSEAMLGASEVIGTLANCSGGVTPWNTVLTCEENFQDYYGEFTDDEGNPQAGSRTEPEDFDITVGYRWQDAPEGAQPPEHYGWVVEVDPFDKDSKPRKHSWLGRIRHENVAMRISDSGRVVAYTGHDENDECIYKFISSGAYDPHDREANMDLLADGMLYVADFSQGRWVALDYENNPIFRENGFAGQADVLVRAPEAAALIEEEDGPPLGTPLDRCEDIEVHPDDGTIYAALTNNTAHGNFHGQIIRMVEADCDPEATEFSFEIFAAGGANTGFSSPDNLAFDGYRNLWMVTDISSASLNSGIYKTFKNNGMFVMPCVNDTLMAGPSEIFQFASGPVEAEMTGPAFTPDGGTLFLAIQHPGEESESVENPSSTWPHDGDCIPKPSVVAIKGFAY
ncbi:MAG: DUF839 domain-containing protein [Rubrobacter sp.]|nr:DUF839 domain-containing protein [Rubrobacter sp.]